MRRICLCCVMLVVIAGMGAETRAAEPLVEQYLISGKLDEGKTALEKQLKDQPEDDQARVGLGVLQFIQANQRVTRRIIEFGVRRDLLSAVESAADDSDDPQDAAFRGLAEALKTAEPKTVTYQDLRDVLVDWVGDFAQIETTLAAVKDPNVTLPLHLGQIQFDFIGRGNLLSVAELSTHVDSRVDPEEAKKFYITFDRGDVAWFRGYCHLLAAGGEFLLALDGEELFQTAAHLLFQKVDTPHKFLLEEKYENRKLSDDENRRLVSDVIAFVWLWRFQLKEPERMQKSLEHLQAAVSQGREMWKFIQSETDDDHEWIPNAKQTGVLRVKVTQEMINLWVETLEDVDLVLQGQRLVPFWRGNPSETFGLNLRRVFTEPRKIDPILWLQGTAATPYLEQGTVTRLASPQRIDELSETFDGLTFFAFAFWFN